MKKAIAVLLLVAVVFGAGAAVAQTQQRFSDVPDGHWAEESIYWAVDNGITSGVGDGLFAPDQTLTRAQMVTFLKRYEDNVVAPRVERLAAADVIGEHLDLQRNFANDWNTGFWIGSLAFATLGGGDADYWTDLYRDQVEELISGSDPLEDDVIRCRVDWRLGLREDIDSC